MISKINIGRYLTTKTWLHQVDPRVKLLINIFLIGASFVFHDLFTLVILSLFILGIFVSLQQGVNYPIKLLVMRILPLTIFVFVIYAWMMPPDGKIFFSSPQFSVSQMGIFVPCRIALRIFVMLMTATICTLTTSPTNLTRAIEDLLTPLKWVKFPVHIVSTVIAIALQFTPNMVDHAKKISQSQASRGIDIRHGNWFVKIRAIKTICIPLLASAFENALQLGAAMDARSYDPYAKRSRFNKLSIRWVDVVILGFGISVLVASIVLKHLVASPSWWW